jgi:hypothetical protein
LNILAIQPLLSAEHSCGSQTDKSFVFTLLLTILDRAQNAVADTLEINDCLQRRTPLHPFRQLFLAKIAACQDNLPGWHMCIPLQFMAL